MIYDNFRQLMEEKIIPFYNENPNAIRLDLRTSGGNINIYSRFIYHDRTWIINSDSRFYRLIEAYTSLQEGIDPFVINGNSLILSQPLPPRPKHLYIYSV